MNMVAHISFSSSLSRPLKLTRLNLTRQFSSAFGFVRSGSSITQHQQCSPGVPSGQLERWSRSIHVALGEPAKDLLVCDQGAGLELEEDEYISPASEWSRQRVNLRSDRSKYSMRLILFVEPLDWSPTAHGSPPRLIVCGGRKLLEMSYVYEHRPVCLTRSFIDPECRNN